MKTKYILMLALALLPMLTVCADILQVRPGKVKPVKTKVLNIQTIKLSPADAAGKVKVEATGQVPTAGWAGEELVNTPNPPKDGKKHLDFVAVKPAGPAAEAITKAEASTTLQAVAGKLTVVVHAATNQKEDSMTVTIGDPP